MGARPARSQTPLGTAASRKPQARLCVVGARRLVCPRHSVSLVGLPFVLPALTLFALCFLLGGALLLLASLLEIVVRLSRQMGAPWLVGYRVLVEANGCVQIRPILLPESMMIRVLKMLAIGALVLLPACKGSSERIDGPNVADLTGTWTGKFSNGINITAPIVQTGTTLTGTFDTGDTQGTISGTHSATEFTFAFTKTSSSGTQRTLTTAVLSDDNKRITGNWNDGAGGQSGTYCLQSPSTPTACIDAVTLTGTWTGRFSNGITITVPLVQTGTTLTGTFDTGDTQGSVSGTHSATAFTFALTKTSSSGTQRTLTAVTLSSDKKRITANWNDGAGGQTGTFCLAAPASTACEIPVPSLTGTWTGKFSNGINITVPLVQTGTSISGTFDTGDTQGTVSGTITASTFTFAITKTSSSGTQRNLTSPAINAGRTRITANWDDGAGGQSGTFCLAAPSSTACP